MEHQLNVQAYLDRISYHQPVAATKECLFELQKRHIYSVPFENLDVHYKNEIKLDINRIYHKVVNNNRGGFCYELNGLFFQLLQAIGFQVKMVSARVYSSKEVYGREHDHLANIVDLEDTQYLVDVGFGKFTLQPLEITFNRIQKDPFGQFELGTYDAGYLQVNEVIAGKLVPRYIFHPQARAFSEFKEMCHFHQTHEDSHFTGKKLISIATVDGRITLNNNQIKITKGGKAEEILFKESEFEQHLKTYFGIESSALHLKNKEE